MNDDHEHLLRSWTAAEQYQRVLRDWAAAKCRDGEDPGKVTEVKITYREKPCRKCPTSDPEINVSVSWEDGSSTTTFDNAETIRSLAEMLNRLVPIAEENSL